WGVEGRRCRVDRVEGRWKRDRRTLASGCCTRGPRARAFPRTRAHVAGTLAIWVERETDGARLADSRCPDRLASRVNRRTLEGDWAKSEDGPEASYGPDPPRGDLRRASARPPDGLWRPRVQPCDRRGRTLRGLEPDDRRPRADPRAAWPACGGQLRPGGQPRRAHRHGASGRTHP